MRLAWTSEGAGPDVVLLAGMGVSRYLQASQRLLGERATVHLLELPGTGRAKDPPRVYGLAEDAAEVVDWTARHLPRGAVFAGHSYCTQVVCRVASAARSLVRGLVLASPTVDPAYRTALRLFARWLVDSRREPRGLGAFQRPERRRAGARRLLRMVSTMLDDDPEVSLSQVEVPVTVVRGRRDAMCTAEWAMQLAEVSGGQLVEVPGAPHAFFVSAAGRAGGGGAGCGGGGVNESRGAQPPTGVPAPMRPGSLGVKEALHQLDSLAVGT